jgi:hypothetical protein
LALRAGQTVVNTMSAFVKFVYFVVQSSFFAASREA